MILLQNLPTMHWGNEEVSVLLAEAYRLKFAFADAPNHYKRWVWLSAAAAPPLSVPRGSAGLTWKDPPPLCFLIVSLWAFQLLEDWNQPVTEDTRCTPTVRRRNGSLKMDFFFCWRFWDVGVSDKQPPEPDAGLWARARVCLRDLFFSAYILHYPANLLFLFKAKNIDICFRFGETKTW